MYLLVCYFYFLFNPSKIIMYVNNMTGRMDRREGRYIYENEF